MGEDSKIQWTDHTFNPWRGCTKVADGCKFCYADAQAKRNPGTLGIWGPHGTRVLASEAMWKQPVKWNKEGDASGTRPRVFCASMADVFEEWKGRISDAKGEILLLCDTCGKVHPDTSEALSESCECGRLKQRMEWVTLDDVRRRLFALIDATPNLDWLLLTKRPEHIRNLWPGIDENLNAPYRSNVWLGVSIANQEDADRNIPLLLQCRDLAPVLFVSYEPAVGPVSFQVTRKDGWEVDYLTGIYERSYGGDSPEDQGGFEGHQGPSLDWVIVGGESGPNARPFDVSWARSAVQQCADAGVPCFVKQLGSVPYMESYHDRKQLGPGLGYQILLKAKKGDDPAEWPEDLRVRQFPAGVGRD